ncbi:hypothetical protein Tsubulata_004242 [Turnera subulata]|uniref:Myb-like domain-containing protein n=1 Tax=Turnera subulata TaxID=218843 RepID=A0A9Q0JEJ1_9ROSI|nr:hypothetical protein Tsubulata_004242 [Turnera subulata]
MGKDTRMGRAPCCEKVGLKRGRWTAEEDEILTKYIQANGEGSWRGNISTEEEEIISKLHASLGNSMPPKRRGGRTSRWAMKKNKSYTQNGVKIPTKRHPDQNNPTAPPAVPHQSSTKPPVETETLSSITNDTLGLNPCGEDKEQVMDITPSPHQEHGSGGMLGMINQQSVITLGGCYSEEVASGNNPLLCPSVSEHESDILGPFPQGIEDAMLCFNEVMGGEELLGPEWDSALNEENRNDVMVTSQVESGVLSLEKATKSDDLDTGNSGSTGESTLDWYSPSPITTSGFDDSGFGWSWEDVIQGQELWNEKEEINALSSLWESDNGDGESKKPGEEGEYDTQNAMVAWLLS